MRSFALRRFPIARAATLVAFAASVGASALASRTAHAQSPGELEAARHLYDEAMELEKKKDFAGALDKLRHVAAIKSTAIVRYHQGYCAEKTGHWVEAADAYARADIDGRGDPAQKEAIDAANEAAAALRPRIPKLRIVARGAAASKAEVKIDEAAINPALVGAAIPVDVGAHVVTVGGDGVTPDRREVTIAEGETKDVTFDVAAGPSSKGNAGDASAGGSNGSGSNAGSNGAVAKGGAWDPPRFGLVFGLSIATLTPGGQLHDPAFDQQYFQAEKGSTDASKWMSTGPALELLAGVRVIPQIVIYAFYQHGFLGAGDHSKTFNSFSVHTDAVGLGAMLDSNPRGAIGFYGDLAIAQRWTKTTESTSRGDIDATLSGLEPVRVKLGLAYKPSARFTFLGYFFLAVGAYGSFSYRGLDFSTDKSIDKTATHTFAGVGLTGLYDLPLP